MTSLVDLVIEKFDGEIVVPNQWRVMVPIIKSTL